MTSASLIAKSIIRCLCIRSRVKPSHCLFRMAVEARGVRFDVQDGGAVKQVYAYDFKDTGFYIY